MKKRYNIVKIDKKDTLKKLLMEAAVNPEYLKKVSEILKRELTAEKDTEDYNLKPISTHYDRPSVLLRESGQKRMIPGDALKVDEIISANEQGREEYNVFYENTDISGVHDYFPFTWKIGQELRTNFILKTEKSDSFESLMDELDGLITNFLSINDWILIKRSIKNAETRLSSGKIRFFQPEVFLGERIPITPTEAKKYGIESAKDGFIDIRKDDHDLLSLKELTSMVKGEIVHPLTIGPGFIAKYMPELKAEGIVSVIFKVDDSKLKEIKLVKKDDSYLGFSPIDAAQSVIETYSTEMTDSIFRKKSKKYVGKDIFGDSGRCYVVVDGAVAGPKDGSPLTYEDMSFNNLVVEAGEVFLFETVGNQVQSTRLSFVPYNYEKLHLVHQHGSVIFGNNDQSFHSCVKDPSQFFDATSKNELLKEIAEDDKILYQPAFIAATLKLLPKGSDPEVLLKSEHKDTLLKVMSSIYEETTFTVDYILTEYSSLPDAGIILIGKYLQTLAPLNKRFVLGKYFEDFNGMMLQRIETSYAQIGEKAHLAYHLNKFKKSQK